MTWNCLKKKVTVPGNLEEETITYRRKKAKGKRQAIFQQFKPEVIHHELMGEACTCPDCHERLKEIGSCVQRWIYQCAESACPVFWKSPVRKEEIMVSDR